MLDTLIIQGELVNPPTELQAFRTLTLMANTSLHLHSVLEIEQEAKDFYWYYLKQACVHDFIEALVTPQEKESGIRLNCQVVDRITCTNLVRLIGLIQCFSSWRR